MIEIFSSLLEEIKITIIAATTYYLVPHYVLALHVPSLFIIIPILKMKTKLRKDNQFYTLAKII